MKKTEPKGAPPLFKRTVWKHGLMNYECCLLYTSDAADERSSVDLGGRRIIKKKKRKTDRAAATRTYSQYNEEEEMRKEEK